MGRYILLFILQHRAQAHDGKAHVHSCYVFGTDKLFIPAAKFNPYQTVVMDS